MGREKKDKKKQEEEKEEEEASNAETLAERVKSAIHRQFNLQMMPERELSTKEGELLNSTGRPLLVIIPNVTEHVMSAMGLDKVDDKGQPKPRRSEAFLNGAPSKSFSGGALKLMAHLNFKYTKSTSVLKVSATYR